MQEPCPIWILSVFVPYTAAYFMYTQYKFYSYNGLVPEHHTVDPQHEAQTRSCICLSRSSMPAVSSAKSSESGFISVHFSIFPCKIISIQLVLRDEVERLPSTLVVAPCFCCVANDGGLQRCSTKRCGLVWRTTSLTMLPRTSLRCQCLLALYSVRVTQLSEASRSLQLSGRCGQLRC